MRILQWTSALVGAALLSGLVFMPEADAQNINTNSAAASATTASTSGSSATTGAATTGNSQGITFNAPDQTTYRGGYYVLAPPQVVAPNLTTTLTDTCMGSWSGSLSLPGVGGSYGQTQLDEDCVARLHARQLVAMGAGDMAFEVLCSRGVVLRADAEMAAPRCAVNKRSATAAKKAADAVPVPTRVVLADCPGYKGADPFVRRRLGCQ